MQKPDCLQRTVVRLHQPRAPGSCFATLAMATAKENAFSEERCMKDLGAVRQEVLLPGFWALTAENCLRWAEEISVGPFWSEAIRKVDQWRTEYRGNTGSDLLAAPGLPKFVAKAEQSIKGKVLRRCKEKSDFLARAFPKSGPPIPHLGDLVRTRIPCRYIDGVEFLTNKIVGLAEEMDIDPKRRREGRIEGYFAQHVVIAQPAIFRLAGQSELATIRCEIQVASDLATRMWEASHAIYESGRGEASDPEDWQWKPTDSRFISHQLGHMIHLADGLLVQLRESTREKKS
jgi:hypothetical protein